MAVIDQLAAARFVRRENVKHYRFLLGQATDEADRKRIHKLLAEERQKQVEAGDPPDNEPQME